MFAYALPGWFSIGRLNCGCRFDLDGIHQVADWLICPVHNSSARVQNAQHLPPGVLGAPSVSDHVHLWEAG